LLKDARLELVEEGATESSFFKILRHTGKDVIFIILALVASLLQGAVFPAYSFFYSEITNV